jgi:hypothetical protein
MKKELPIAVILLAFGAWCWTQYPVALSERGVRDASDLVVAPRPRVNLASWQTPVEPTVQTESESVAQASISTIPSQPKNRKNGPSQPNSIASWGHSAALRSDMRTLVPAEFLNAAHAAKSGDIELAQANESVTGLANALLKLPPFATHTKIYSRLFGVSVVANGKYFQTVGGIKSRMEIQCVAPVPKTVLQMSDGRFVYTLKSDRHQQKLEFIDLYRLANRRGTAEGALLPTTWVIGGGMGQSLVHYAEAFDFLEVGDLLPQQSAGDSINVRTFRGVWKPDVLLRLLNAGVSQEKKARSVVWADVPRQIPHAIELTFAVQPGGPEMPRQISFFQFETAKKETLAHEKVRIELMPFQFRTEMPDALFTLESTDFEATDVTNIYNARISKLSQGVNKVAHQFPSVPRF